ncbi:MAG: 30S ribosomal protein S5 [Verrucomicrobia bacterium]|nr:30S ribosomal protein S5 [Verrucomicrobiota bacterium]
MAEVTENIVPEAPGGGGNSGGGRGPGRGGFGRGGGGQGRGPARRRNPGESDMQRDGEGNDLVEKVVFINRSAKVVKGGRRFSFSALVVVGDKKGRVGIGLGKAVEVSEAIKKGGEFAKRNMVNVVVKDGTIPHEIFCSFDGAKVLLRPASPGTGIIAGKKVRAILESAGIKDILTKSLGSKNAANVVKATLNGLLQMRLPEDIYAARGLKYTPRKTATTPEAPVAAAVVA